ncbi:hypothetical protein GCM10023151_12430 [Kangiella marina]|uniref:CAAX prenyl protease 2/Lysostaphin resistance protein A-like domain-containing protein n=2 Tax=Kangiella marina TaxID=1079178 RepID=A0ABP8IJK3_9GAMM
MVLILSVTGSLVISYTLLALLTQEYLVTQFLPRLSLKPHRILIALASGAAIAYVVSFVSSQYPPQAGESNTFRIIQSSGLSAQSLLIFVTVLLAPLCEEYLFRGIIFDALKTRFTTFFAICASAVVFMGFHLIEYSDYWVGMSAIFLLGIALAFLRESSNSMLSPILCHASYNAGILWLA